MSLKVLLADDSMTAQNMAKKILADSGYEVTTVSNGAAAVKKIAEIKPDLVILDIYMPGYTGLEVCERVRANLETSNLPVLLTVGKMEPYRAEDGARVRADGIIVKPFEATDLINIVKKISDKFAPVKPANYGELETSGPVATKVEEFPEPSAEETPQAIDVPAEMAAVPAMAIDEVHSAGNMPAAMEWESASASVAPEALEFPTPLPVEPAAPSTTDFATPNSFVSTHEEAEAGIITDSMPAYVDSEMAPSFQIEPIQDHMERAATPEIEFNSVPQAKDVTVERSADLEPTIHTEDAPLVAEQDPALVTSMEELSGFVTNFGVENAEDVPVGTVTGDEAFLPANWVQDMPEPLAAEEVFPKASAEEAEEPSAEEHAVESLDFMDPAPVVAEEHEEPAPAMGKESVDDFDARVAAAMSAFDQPLANSEPELMVEQVDNFVGDAEIVNPIGVESDSAAIEATPASSPEPVHAMEPSRMLDVNETMVLPAEALLSLEAEMRKAVELKKAAASLDEREPSHEQIMDDFTGPQERAALKMDSVEEPVASELPAAGRDDDEFAKAVAARLREISDPEPELHAEESQATAKPLAMAAAIPADEKVNAVGDETLAVAIKKAVERLQPQLIAEIMKALKGE